MQVSVLISSTQQHDDSSADEEDALITFPDLARRWVSTESLTLHARTSGSWWKTMTGNLVPRKTANDRCSNCQACLDVSINTCKRKKEPLCGGCYNQSTCWGQVPCETWTKFEKARHYAQFSAQAYNHPAPNNRLDLIMLVPYRLDLDVNNGTMVRLLKDPNTGEALDPPPAGLDGSWNQAKENLMRCRMLGEEEGLPDLDLEPD